MTDDFDPTVYAQILESALRQLLVIGQDGQPRLNAGQHEYRRLRGGAESDVLRAVYVMHELDRWEPRHGEPEPDINYSKRRGEYLELARKGALWR